MLQENTSPVTHSLPSVSELLETAETDAEALNIIHRHRDLIREVEALRLGAKEIIDVRPQDKTK